MVSNLPNPGQSECLVLYRLWINHKIFTEYYGMLTRSVMFTIYYHIWKVSNDTMYKDEISCHEISCLAHSELYCGTKKHFCEV